MSSTDFENISFDLPKNQSNVIKVIGVGGGGSNAINHMFQQGIKGVDFVICNTDSQALDNSSVPNKIQLGVSLTEGLGAGANPHIGEQAAVESFDDIKRMLDTHTKMVFITAGMGGGTGTGAAPIIAQQAKELDILTVGIVTSPFQFEGKQRNKQAQEGVEKLRSQVDSLIVINNNKLREVYGNLGFKAGFSKADEVLATAARGIAEVITHHYTQNIDLRDAKTVLSDSGTAIMGSAQAAGANRASEAIRKALDSPLLNDNKITGAKNVLLLIVSGQEEITLDEIGEINDHIQEEAGQTANIIMGVGEDENLDDAVAVTIIATGFDVEQQNEIVNTETKKIIHTLEDEQRAEQQLTPRSTGAYSGPLGSNKTPQTTTGEKKVVHKLSTDDEEPKKDVPKTEGKSPNPVEDEVSNFSGNNEKEVPYQSPESQDKDNFIINDEEGAKVKDQELTDEKSEPHEQFTITFDFPRNPEAEEDSPEDSGEDLSTPTNQQPSGRSNVSNEPSSQLSEQSKPVQKEPQEQKIVHRLSDEGETKSPRNTTGGAPEFGPNGEKRYSLDDYMEVEEMLNQSEPTRQSYEEVEPKVVRQVKQEEVPEQPAPTQEEDPFDNPIPEAVVQRAEERRAKMKAFNYKFRTNLQKIDDIEKQPAYKRAGVQLDDRDAHEEKLSRTTLGNGEDDEINFRRNNSFLHDNVD